MKKLYRISPALSNSSQNAWQVEFVRCGDNGEIKTSIGYFKTLKRAKSVVAHFRKKPIEIATRS